MRSPSSSTSPSSSNKTSTSTSSFSLATLLQYVAFALIAYVLAGAPLLESLRSGSGAEGQDAGVSAQKLEALVVPEGNLSCPAHAYRGVHVVSREPLVVYVEGFLGEAEAEEVVGLRYVFISLLLGFVSCFFWWWFSSLLFFRHDIKS